MLGGYFQLIVPKSVRKSPNYRLDDHAFDSFQKLLDDAGNRGVQVDVVQLPMHIVSLERYAMENRWNVYEQWLRRLTAATDAHNRRMPGSIVRFWDFCGYSPINSEAYPGPRDVSTNMKWYWDPFHFKKELGDVVIDRLMNVPPPADVDITGFGQIITRENLRSHLAKLRLDHEAYFASHADIRAIEEAVRASRAAGEDVD